MKKTAQSQIKATLNYTSNALERVSTLIISRHEEDVYEALQVIKAHHNGNRAGAIKAAIIEYAKHLQANQ